MRQPARSIKKLLVTILTLFVVNLAVGQAAAQSSGLISWWDGDSVSGTTVFDIANGNDGTLVNGATTAPGKVGNAFSFDGIDDFIQVPDSNVWTFRF